MVRTLRLVQHTSTSLSKVLAPCCIDDASYIGCCIDDARVYDDIDELQEWRKFPRSYPPSDQLVPLLR